jgi:VWFA-related protein
VTAGRGLTLGAAIAASVAVSGQQTGKPVFRTQTDVVSVSVAVYDGRRPIAGLGVPDFSLTDNKVPQAIDSVTAQEVPIDVTLAVDVSGSTADHLNQYRSDVAQIAKLLEPEDRLRLIAFGTDVVEVLPLQRQSVPLPLDALQMSGMTSLNDALVDALVRAVPFDRRHLAVAFTDGHDTLSVTTADRVLEVARQSETVLHLVITGSASIPSSSIPRSWPIPARTNPQGREVLLEAAEITGGRRGWPGVFTASVLGAFKEIFNDFRASYVLKYRPGGVPQAGWHDIAVTVPKQRGYTIRARRGYGKL